MGDLQQVKNFWAAIQIGLYGVIKAHTPPRLLTRKVTLMTNYCLMAREAAEQIDLSLDALMARSSNTPTSP